MHILEHVFIFIVVALFLGAAESSAQNPPRIPTRPEVGEGSAATRVAPDVAVLRTGRPKFVVSGPPDSSNAVVETLTNAGARLISTRNLSTLNRRVLLFDFQNRLSLRTGREILAQSFPNQIIDFNHLYRLSQAKPRLYAPSLVGDPTHGCRVSKTQRIGIIDGPVNPNHKAMVGVQLTLASTLRKSMRPTNTNHGTAVATLIVGEAPDGELKGFAAGGHLFAASAFGKERNGMGADVERIGASLNWLLANNVKLINMSFTGPSNYAFEDLLRQAHRKGAVMIAAVGNDGRKVAKYPAASPSVVAVTAVDARMRRYRSANWGEHVEFAAPGVDLYVAERGGGGYATGTSYAAPIVTAFAARLGSRSVDSLRESLRSNVVDLGSPGRDTKFGWGFIHGLGCFGGNNY
jgi:hypothetical protein